MHIIPLSNDPMNDKRVTSWHDAISVPVKAAATEKKRKKTKSNLTYCRGVEIMYTRPVRSDGTVSTHSPTPIPVPAYRGLKYCFIDRTP